MEEALQHLPKALRSSYVCRIAAVSVVCAAALALLSASLTTNSDNDGSSVPSCNATAHDHPQSTAPESSLVAVDNVTDPGALTRIVRRQAHIIEELTQDNVRLRHALRALELHSSSKGVRQKVYHAGMVEEDQPSHWQQRTLRKHGAYGFVYYSAYRVSPTRIVVLGLGRINLWDVRRVTNCTWFKEAGERVEGTLTAIHWDEFHDLLYQLIFLHCDLPSQEDTSEAQSPPSPNYTLTRGGHLRVVLDAEVWYPYKEQEGTKLHSANSTGPFEHHCVFCSATLFGDLGTKAMLQWTNYHRYHAGYGHYFFYDTGGINEEQLLALEPLIQAGLVTVTDFREGAQYESWARGQALTMHDCLLRNRNTAEWVSYHDLDEYLLVPPPHSLPEILSTHRGRPWLTHGCFAYDARHCEVSDVWDPHEARWAVELLVHREPVPFCSDTQDRNICTNHMGYRKFFANPRKVERMYIHRVDTPGVGGVDLPVPHISHAHYRALFLPNMVCNGTPDSSASFKDSSIADVARKARECSLEGFVNEKKCSPGWDTD